MVMVNDSILVFKMGFHFLIISSSMSVNIMIYDSESLLGVFFININVELRPSLLD